MLLDTPLASTAAGREVVVPMLSGMVAGMCFWTSSYPCDFAKTRVQASKTKVSISDIIRTTYAADGVSGFYRGYTACPSTFPLSERLGVVGHGADHHLHHRARLLDRHSSGMPLGVRGALYARACTSAVSHSTAGRGEDTAGETLQNKRKGIEKECGK